MAKKTKEEIEPTPETKVFRFDEVAMIHLKAEMQWLKALLELHLRRMQSQGLLPPPEDPFPGTTVAPGEIEARLERDASGPKYDLASLEERGIEAVNRAEAHRSAVRDKALQDGFGLPLERIRRNFRLNPTEYLLFLLSVAAEFDPSFPRIFAYLQNHFERQYATLALVADCLVPPGMAADVRRLLDEESPLVRYRLVRLPPGRPETSIMQRPLVAEPRIIRYIEGDLGLDDVMKGYCTLVTGDGPTGEMIIPPDNKKDWERLHRVIEVCDGNLLSAPVLVFRGADGIGKTRWCQEAASELGLGTLKADVVSAQRVNGSLEAGLAVLFREALLQDSALCLTHWDDLVTPPPVPVDDPVQGSGGNVRERTACRLVDGFLRGHHGLVALMVRDMEAPIARLCRNREVFDLVMPDVPMSRALWDRLLQESIRGEGVSPEDLADAFRLTPGQMVEAVHGSAQRLASEGARKPKVDYDLLSEIIKEQVRHRLGENASLVRARYSWDDLILKDDCQLQLREFVSRYHQRNKVLDTWGFGARFGYDMGLSALFDGPPGTGKTMAASIVAAELGLDLYKIDLSRIVSRYVGETEKNLSQVFDEAERARAMLLFDEADSLFAKRTSVQSSNDRYANLEVNYLLQRVETFTGVAVLTTNFASSIDEAFSRRLSMRITFPKPEAAEREKLWKTMIINSDLLEGEVDFGYLGAEFELAGGHIKNAVLRAAFIAASRDRKIDEDLLDLAARIELKEQGMLVHGNPIEELWADDRDSGS